MYGEDKIACMTKCIGATLRATVPEMQIYI